MFSGNENVEHEDLSAGNRRRIAIFPINSRVGDKSRGIILGDNGSQPGGIPPSDIPDNVALRLNGRLTARN